MDAELSLAPDKISQHALKRLMDIVGAALLLALCAPLFGVLMLLVSLESPGAIFFCQERIGAGGRRFRMFKFRSMYDDDGGGAFTSYLDGNPQGRHDYEKYQKLPQDPRLTRLGRFMRRTSLDELPQLLNVLMGEMSLVGPRPFLPEQLKLYGPTFQCYQLARPGLTGLWQVSGRNHLSFQERVTLDQQYIQEWSLRLDMKILLKTPLAVLTQDGAY